jgi:hypothetical protein
MTEQEMREIVESCGYWLAIDMVHPGRYRIVTHELESVAAVTITPKSFQAVFPGIAWVSSEAKLQDTLQMVAA